MKIKYDKRTIKVLLITTFASLVLFLAGMIVMYFEITGLALLFLFGIYAGGGLLIYSLLNLVCAVCYFRRLKMHGYEVPYDRNSYGNDLKNVPNSCDSESSIDISNQRSKESVILAIFHFMVFVFTNVWNICYIIHWYKYVEDNAVFLLCVQIILDLGWLIAAIVYFRQRDNEKYRDDVELDLSKKERSGIEKGILTGLVVLAVTVFIKAMVVNMADYVFHARQAKDQSIIEDIQSCISAAYFDMNQNDASTLQSCDSYLQMVKGCYISEWSKPQDVFASDIAKMLEISDYSELADEFAASEGRAQIYVEISNDKVYVALKNPLLVDHGYQPSYEAGEK